MRKIRIIAAREYKLALTSWPFWLVTLGLPAFVVLITAIALFIGFAAGKNVRPENKDQLPLVLGIVDHAQLMDWEALNETEPHEVSLPEDLQTIIDGVSLPQAIRSRLEGFAATVPGRSRPLDYAVFETATEAEAALKSRRIRGYLEIPADYNTNPHTRLTTYGERTHIPMSMVENDLRNDQLMRQLGAQQAAHILNPLDDVEMAFLEQPKSAAEGETEVTTSLDLAKKVKSFALPMAFMMVFIFVVATSTDRLLRGLVEEKTNRVIEILLSSTTSDQLMMGKVLGLGLVGLTQLAIWLFIGILPLSWILLFVQIDFAALLVFLVFFILGYFLFASMVLGLGSLGKNLHEANQWLAVLMILAVIPMALVPALLTDPDGTAARVLTWVPFTSPLVVVLRFGADAITFWELSGAAAVLAGANLVVSKISARLFRVGILMTGKTPNPLEVWRALKHD